MRQFTTSVTSLQELFGSYTIQGMIIKRISLEYIVGLVFSVVGFFGLVGLHSFLEMIGFEVTWGGDKGKFFWGMFFGLPTGSIVGFLLVDRLYFKVDTWNFLGMLLAFIVSVFANLVGLYFMDQFGGGFFLAIPPLVVLACVCAFAGKWGPRCHPMALI